MGDFYPPDSCIMLTGCGECEMETLVVTGFGYCFTACRGSWLELLSI